MTFKRLLEAMIRTPNLDYPSLYLINSNEYDFFVLQAQPRINLQTPEYAYDRESPTLIHQIRPKMGFGRIPAAATAATRPNPI